MTTIDTESGRPQRRRVAGINDARYKGGHHDSCPEDGRLLPVWEWQGARGDAR